jgi:hypothetical protein
VSAEILATWPNAFAEAFSYGFGRPICGLTTGEIAKAFLVSERPANLTADGPKAYPERDVGLCTEFIILFDGLEPHHRLNTDDGSDCASK